MDELSRIRKGSLELPVMVIIRMHAPMHAFFLWCRSLSGLDLGVARIG